MLQFNRYGDMTQNPNEILIRNCVENWAKAVRDQDMDAILAHHTADIVMYDVPMPFRSQGIDEYKQTWDLFFKHNKGGEGSFDIVDLKIYADEAVAFCYGVISIFGTRVRLTMGFTKTDWQWMIAHEHHSYPIELE